MENKERKRKRKRVIANKEENNSSRTKKEREERRESVMSQDVAKKYKVDECCHESKKDARCWCIHREKESSRVTTDESR